MNVMITGSITIGIDTTNPIIVNDATSLSTSVILYLLLVSNSTKVVRMDLLPLNEFLQDALV